MPCEAGPPDGHQHLVERRGRRDLHGDPVVQVKNKGTTLLYVIEEASRLTQMRSVRLSAPPGASHAKKGGPPAGTKG